MKLRTFIVEDDAFTAQSLKDILERSGDVEVVGIAARESDAVLWLVSNPDRWSLVIIDYKLAQGDGLRVLAACRVRRAGQHAVMLSAHGNGVLRRRCADLGADDMFDKLAGLSPLLERCRQWRLSAERATADARLTTESSPLQSA